ncbi:MAG: hypothetical protein V2A74_08375, partial [bacterium]
MDRIEMRPRVGRKPGGWLTAGLTALLGLSIGVGQGAAQDEVPLESLVRHSDTIAWGQVKKNETRWVGGHLETTTHIQVERYLKGNRGDDLAVTQVGGSISKPIPITQRATNQTEFYEGEEVIVYLSTQPERSEELKKKADPNTGLLSTPVVVGGKQGKVNVITDPDGGAKKIATYRDEALSLRALKQAQRAAAAKEEHAKQIEEKKSEATEAAKSTAPDSSTEPAQPEKQASDGLR